MRLLVIFLTCLLMVIITMHVDSKKSKGQVPKPSKGKNKGKGSKNKPTKGKGKKTSKGKPTGKKPSTGQNKPTPSKGKKKPGKGKNKQKPSKGKKKPKPSSGKGKSKPKPGKVGVKPNIVFILVDDLGWNDVSWHNPQVLTPNLAALAQSGVILEQAYTHPTCSPSRAALMTGRYASRTGFQFMPHNALEPTGLPTSFTLLPEFLTKRGYSSHGLGKWHLGFCSPDYLPTHRGFQSFLGFWNGGGDHLQHITPADSRDVLRSMAYDFHFDEKIYLNARGRWTDELFVDRVGEILASRTGFSNAQQGKIHMENYNSSNPLFLYLSYQKVHTPLAVDPKYANLYPNIEDASRRTYLGMVSAVDDSVGRIVQMLKDYTYTSEEGEVKDLFADTVFVFSSDNGGMSAGMGYGGADNSPLRGRKGDTWEGGCRVPSFISGSGINTKRRSDIMFHMTDWLPTLYAGLAGGDIQDLGDIDGLNQLAVLQGEKKPERIEILYDIANFQNTNYIYYVPQGLSGLSFPLDFDFSGSFGAALRVGKFKILVGCSTTVGCTRNYNSALGGNTHKNRVLLYNLETDPEEQTNLAEDMPEVVEELRTRLEVHLKRAVKPEHIPVSQAGHPNNHSPPRQFFTGWCQAKVNPDPLE